VTRTLARALTLLLFVRFGLAVPPTSRAADPDAEQTVFLAGKLRPEQLVGLSANLAASRHPGVLLLDSTNSSPYHQRYLNRLGPARIVPVGAFDEVVVEIEQRLEKPIAPFVAWKSGTPREFLRELFSQAETVVVCPPAPYRLLLHAACLAGALRAPLYISGEDSAEEGRQFRRLLNAWQTNTIYAIGTAPRLWRGHSDLRVLRLSDENAVAASYLRHQPRRGPIRTLVIANPGDLRQTSGVLSPLAPWLALNKRAALLLTEPDGKNVNELVRQALKQPALEHVDNVILLADLQAIPTEQRPNPIAGKDTHIEMEPLTPSGMEPFSFAVGRLFNADPSVVALVLARERLLTREKTHQALVVSNPGGSLPLLETFSRNTAQELKNRGLETRTLFGGEVSKTDMRRLLPEQDIFLWEGHHNTLINDYEFPKWTEPLQPSLMFIQSCLALKDFKLQPLLERGALCVVGTSTRTFSATGGAFSLSFFDALLYEDQSIGGSLRHAKNFLLTYALLKEKRLGKDAKLTGANLRSAWAFTLWGDPTLRLPLPPRPDDALPPVRHQVVGNTITLKVPVENHAKTATTKYQAQIRPNGRLAGLIARDLDEDQQPLVPFAFAEVALPRAPAGKVPVLTSRLNGRRWAFLWDSRRRCGYLLVTPRDNDGAELRFHVAWEDE
jgi:hypothetical protein